MNSGHYQQKSNQNPQVPVYLNVYNFWPCFNKIFDPIGIGVYHTGVQLYDDQYMFFGFDGDQTGVGYIQPFQAAYQFKQQILLGYTNLTFFQFDDKLLDPLRQQFTGNKYDLLQNNCNHFARRLTKQLNVQQKFPQKIFRVTDCCNLFRCCIPQCILNGRLDWFNWSSQSSQSHGYYELQQSVKDQIDMKMLQQKQKIKYQQIQQQIKKLQPQISTTPTTDLHKINENHKSSPNDIHLHQIPKHTTLKKGIWPHLENAHERASINQLPNLSPKSLGNQDHSFQLQRKTKMPSPKKYPNQDVIVYKHNNKNSKIHEKQ